ncbi:uncharacterized protein LOC144574275 isoform X2 [Carex rostrata]
MHVARSTAQCSGLIFFNRCQTRTPIGKVSKVKLPLIKVSAPIIRQTFPLTNLKECAATGRDGTKNVYYDDKFDPDPFWSSLIKEILWCLRDLFQFLAEQPSQLKYIEWPSFQRTLKTATLTLVIVVFLIVALCSVDSALCYILAWFSRKSA